MALNATDPPPIDYSSRDYASIRADGIILIPLFLPEWTDHNQTDPGIALLGLFSAAEDRLNYYIDTAVNQSNIITALTRTAIVNHAKTLGYNPAPPDAATVDLTLTIAAPVPGPGALTVPAGQQVPASTGAIFELDSNAVFPFDGVTTQLTDVAATHGVTVSELLAVSNGRGGQFYQFTSYAVLADDIDVLVNAVAWTRTSSLILEGSTDQVYYLQWDQNDKVTVYFGDGTNGAIPPAGQNINVSYRVGGGVVGQVAAGSINSTQNIAYGVPPTIAVTFTNPAASSGGGPHESDTEIQINAPRNWATQERCVSMPDYVTKALQVSGVGKAEAYPAYINIVTVYVAPVNGGLATAALLTNVETALQTFMMGTDTVVAMGVSYVDVVITGTVTVLRDYDRAATETLTNLNVKNLYAFANRSFGQNDSAVGDAKFSNLVGVVENSRGVDYIVLDEFRLEPVVVYDTWQGDPVIQNIATNDETVAETWTVQWVSATQFAVTGSLSGPQPTLGTVGTTYTSDDTRVSFEMTAVAMTDPVPGDRATFRVSKYLANDNIRVLRGEIARLLTVNLSLTYVGGV